MSTPTSESACSSPLVTQQHTEHWLPREQDIQIFFRRWEPLSAPETPRYLILVHGACEHGDRYTDLAEQAAGQGWTVLIPDHRGHGRSTGEYVHVDRFSQFTDDLRALLLSQNCLPEQTVILGNSMGGLISLRAVQEQHRQQGTPLAAGLILLSPLLAIKHPIANWKKLVSGFLSQYFPRTRFRSTINQADLTHNSALIERRKQDPLQRSQVTARWYTESNHAMEQAFAEGRHLTIPTYIWQAGEDRIVAPEAARRWAEHINQSHSQQARPLVVFESLPGWFHELLNEPEGPQLRERILEQASQFLQTPFQKTR